ncbi:hypothetical protein C9374_013757 [Naegleria lovaniensis]|uniref:Guanine nucleotide-binding protein subunit beta-like protein n=1 Tax=Naegleria lovaniensis TaxID=51637 RepID=A0AA88GEI4_NAELO|nr:uncharacterized protein C9374_013757 [Naegleria lovaniensis]KAG2370882.1 hypothetical protein C9374_013757 [Naegleria lovaniensis]
MKEVQLYLTKIISNYIDGVYEYNDGSMYADLKLTMNTIKTKLSSSTLTSTTLIKAAQMMQLMLGLEDVSEKQNSIIEETSGSKHPKPNENSSPYAVFCREIDFRREEMKLTYANNAPARNVAEARCEKLDEFYSSKFELGKGMLSGDIFVTRAESVMATVGGITGKMKFTRIADSKNANSYCIDIKKNTVLVTSPKSLNSYKISTNSQLEPSYAKEFTINASNDNISFGAVATLDGLVAVADTSQNVVYCYSPYTKKPSHGFKLPVYENNRSIYMMKFHPMTRTLFTASSNVIFSVFMENRFYDVPFVGFGSTVTDFCFDPTSASVLLASSADHNVYLFDYRQQVSPILKFQGHADRVEACEFSLVGGIPFVWSAGNDESIRCWDLRMQAPLYELSTGNGRPLSIQWHDSSSTLLCNVAFDHCNSEEWPETAMHNRKHFSKKFSITSSAIIRYQFKDSIPFNCSSVHSSGRSPQLGGSSSVASSNHSTQTSSKKSSQKSKKRK